MNFKDRIKISKLRKRMGSIGNNTKLPFDLDYQSPECIYIGDNVRFGSRTQLIAICNYDYGKQFDIHPSIKIGNNVWSTGFLTIWCAGEVSIGENTMIAQGCVIVDCNHGVDASCNDFIRQQITMSYVKIGDGCWIGANVIFLPSSSIGNHVIVGAGSIVTKCFPDYCMIAGNPAKIIKIFNKETREWEKYVSDKR